MNGKHLATRRKAREWALQLLVQFDLNEPVDVDAEIEAFWTQQADLEAEELEDTTRRSQEPLFTSEDADVQESIAKMRTFTIERVKGAWMARNELDGEIERYLRNWSMYRLGTIERNVLRLGAWELLNCYDIPAPIVVNEAVDLVKFFSETKGGRFVNGVLDNFAKGRAWKHEA